MIKHIVTRTVQINADCENGLVLTEKQWDHACVVVEQLDFVKFELVPVKEEADKMTLRHPKTRLFRELYPDFTFRQSELIIKAAIQDMVKNPIY